MNEEVEITEVEEDVDAVSDTADVYEEVEEGVE